MFARKTVSCKSESSSRTVCKCIQGHRCFFKRLFWFSPRVPVRKDGYKRPNNVQQLIKGSQREDYDGYSLCVAVHQDPTDFGLVHTTPTKFENAALFLRLRLPSTLIRHENAALFLRLRLPSTLIHHENAALFLRLHLLYTLIRHEKGALWKYSSNQPAGGAESENVPLAAHRHATSRPHEFQGRIAKNSFTESL